MNTTFRQRLRNGERVLGTIVSLNCPAVVELLSEIGFDWFFLDGEHSAYSASDIQPLLQAASDDVACIVRVPGQEEGPIKHILDLGATGVIVPQVNTAEEASKIVSYCRYSPEGARGVGIGRAHAYGLKFQEYVKRANEEVTVIVQAEHIDAVKNIESIVKVDGVDAVLIGPYDLSASMGKMGQLDDAEVVSALKTISSTCMKAGMPVGIFGLTPDSVKPYIDEGYTLIVVGVDTLLLGNAAKGVLRELA